jgi:hypothetical protein
MIKNLMTQPIHKCGQYAMDPPSCPLAEKSGKCAIGEILFEGKCLFKKRKYHKPKERRKRPHPSNKY